MAFLLTFMKSTIQNLIADLITRIGWERAVDNILRIAAEARNHVFFLTRHALT
jgi:hypothetical protein